MERRRIIINFKNTPEDIELYEKLKKHSSISGYVKDVLKGLNVEVEKKEVKVEEDLNEDISDILNILED